MTQVVAIARAPFPPHVPLAISVLAGADYGFMLSGVNQVELAVPLTDPNDAIYYSAGRMLSIERSDGALDWWGFITDSEEPSGEAYAYISAQDHAGALFEQARTAKGWGEMYAPSGEVIRRVFAEAARRAEPSLLVDVPEPIGPMVRYTPAAEPISDFLNTMSELTDWEWQVVYRQTTHEMSPKLLWQRRIGKDYRGSVMFEEGHHFTALDFGRHAKGFLRAGLAIGGTGTLADRPAVQVNPQGRADRGIVGRALVGRERSRESPSFAGTRTMVEPFVRNEAALGAAGQRLHASPDLMGEALSFRMWDAPNVDGVASVDTSVLEIGGQYGVRFLARGVQVVRDIRAIALAVGEDHSIEIVAEVLADEAFAA